MGDVDAAPETRYARSGDVNIAYQVVGDGPFDLVFVPGYVTHLELAWKLPGFGPALHELASFSRLIKFDKRGTGMSDPVSGAPTLETRMDDVRAVMDAVGSRAGRALRALRRGVDERAVRRDLPGADRSARPPQPLRRGRSGRRTIRGGAPRTNTSGRSSASCASTGLGIRRCDGHGRSGRFDDEELEAFVDYLRYGASPGMLEGLLRMNKEIDIRHVLPAVRVPTLVLHGADDEFVPLEAARYLAGRIPGARYVELPGVGHLALGGARIASVSRSSRFLTDVWSAGGWNEAEPERMLATVLFTDIVDATGKALELGDRAWRELLERHHAIVRRELIRFRGREIDTAGDGFFADLRRAGARDPLRLRHRGQRARAGHRRPGGPAHGRVRGRRREGRRHRRPHRLACRDERAGPARCVVSSTVKDLVAGSGIDFEDRGQPRAEGNPRRVAVVQRRARRHLAGAAEGRSSQRAGPRPPGAAARRA